MREGPKVLINTSCTGCKHEHSEKYVCQGDSGWDNYCQHPDIGHGYIGDNGSSTPNWCPFKSNAISVKCSQVLSKNPDLLTQSKDQ